jgi:enoyl-CoA hydratase/carnithine racemase
VTGSGKAFCAGADLGAGENTFAGDDTWKPANAIEATVRPWNMNKPIICAINGAAVGIGATLPLQWDIRLASDRAKIGFVFTRRGIVAEAGSTWILPRIVGFARAMDLLLTGRILTAAEALEQGLVSRVVPHDDLLSVAQGIARDIAENTAPVSIAITKRLLWRQLMETDPRPAKELEDILFHWTGKQPDAGEGVTSFLEKRAPKWKMHPSRDLPDAIAPLRELGDEKR